MTMASTNDQNPTAGCVVCGSPDTVDLVDLRQVPVHCNVLWKTEHEARTAPRGDIRLLFCRRCTHVFNATFDPALMEYSPSYENSLHFSPRFQRYAEDLADRLIARHRLRGKRVIDIGCGKGEFLALVCERGQNEGLGFDPSFDPQEASVPASTRIRVVQDFYSEKYAREPADLLMCRQVLEHIRDPRAFLATIRKAADGPGRTPLFVEVPNVLYTLRDRGIWDIIYEHCSYFTGASLARLFEACDYDVTGLESLYQDQFLGIDALPRFTRTIRPEILPEQPEEISGLADGFARLYRSKVAEWGERLNAMSAAGRKGVVWGSGSKGVMFLNALQPAAPIAVVVDINPRKQGMFVAGTGQPIVSPETLRTVRPDAVVIMNPVYLDEIRGSLASLGISAEILQA